MTGWSGWSYQTPCPPEGFNQHPRKVKIDDLGRNLTHLAASPRPSFPETTVVETPNDSTVISFGKNEDRVSSFDDLELHSESLILIIRHE